MLTHQSQPQSIDWEEGGEWDRGSEEGEKVCWVLGVLIGWFDLVGLGWVGVRGLGGRLGEVGRGCEGVREDRICVSWRSLEAEDRMAEMGEVSDGLEF